MDTSKPKIVFLTGNSGKFSEFSAILSSEFEIEQHDLDLPEYQGTPMEVATEKIKLAYSQLKRPLIAEDSSLCFNAYGGLPGVYIKWFSKAIGNDGLVKMVKAFDDHSGYSQCIFSYMDEHTVEPISFIGRIDGTIVDARGTMGFGWDAIFQPVGHQKTFGEMNAEEKNVCSHRNNALQKVKDHFLTKSNPQP
jgi:inosine triphosphate pyrophosphatase